MSQLSSKKRDLSIGAAVLGALLLGLSTYVLTSDKPGAEDSAPESAAINDKMMIVMKHVAEIAKQPVGVTSVAVATDGKTVATGLSDGGLVVSETARGEVVHRLSGHAGAVNGVAFWPDGRLVSGGSDGTIRLWDTITAECLRVLTVDRPYEAMNISGVTGLADAQTETLRVLGAIKC